MAGPLTPQQEAGLIQRLAFIASAIKTFDANAQWKETYQKDRRQLASVIGVRVAGVLEGTAIRLVTPGHLWERDVYSQIEVYDPLVRRNLRLIPVEWRPLHPHDNPGSAPGSLRYLTLYDRYHPFDLNAPLGLGVFLRDTRGIAAPLPNLVSFQEYLMFCGHVWNCPDMLTVPVPPWREELI